MPSSPSGDGWTSVVPVQGSKRFQETQRQAPARIPPIPGNLGADFFAKLEFEARRKAGIVEEWHSSGNSNSVSSSPEDRAPMSFSAARRQKGGDELDARLLRGIQSRCKDLGTPHKLKEIRRDFKLMASDGGMSRARPWTPRERKEQERRAEALARIKAIGGHTPACGRRARHEVQHALLTSMQVDPSVVDSNRRPEWPTLRRVRLSASEFLNSDPRVFRSVRTEPELSTPKIEADEEPSEEQRKADELRALAGEMTSEQKKAALRKRQEEVKFLVMTPDDWRCSTHGATNSKPQKWQWAGIAGALAQEDPSAVQSGEDPRWSEREMSLIEVCDGSDLDPELIHSIANGAKTAQWTHPDATGRTALHAICQNPALHVPALEAVLDHAPFAAWRSRCDSEHGSTPLHLLCANQTAFDSDMLGLVLQRAATSLPLRSRSTATSALWTLPDDNGCNPLHALCGNALGFSSHGSTVVSEAASHLPRPHAIAQHHDDFKILHAHVAYEREAEAALKMHVPETDRIHMDPAELEILKTAILSALANKKPVPEAIAAARAELSVRQKSRQAADRESREGVPSLPPTPSGVHAETQAGHSCAEQLHKALMLAFKSAPKTCWYMVDTAGRQPMHHLLENPVHHSCELGTTMVAELEGHLAMHA